MMRPSGEMGVSPICKSTFCMAKSPVMQPTSAFLSLAVLFHRSDPETRFARNLAMLSGVIHAPPPSSLSLRGFGLPLLLVLLLSEFLWICWRFDWVLEGRDGADVDCEGAEVGAGVAGVGGDESEVTGLCSSRGMLGDWGVDCCCSSEPEGRGAVCSWVLSCTVGWLIGSALLSLSCCSKGTLVLASAVGLFCWCAGPCCFCILCWGLWPCCPWFLLPCPCSWRCPCEWPEGGCGPVFCL